MKKKFIIGGIAVVVITAVVVAVLLLTRNNQITITFDTDGAKNISAIKINKGESVKLPNIKKQGFIFGGWYLKDERVTNSTTFDKDTTLKAKWINEEAKTFTVTFDSDGGSKVESIVVECGKELLLPTNPTKTGYSFISWIDKNETPIYDKALLACEDISLKANWKKEETKPTENTETPTQQTQPVTPKSYKCPTGYELTEDNQCETKVHVTENCAEGLSKSESRGLCYASVPVTKKCNVGVQINGYCYSVINNLLSNYPKACATNNYYYVNGICYEARNNLDSVCPTGYSVRPAGWADPSQTSEACIHTEITQDTCPDGYSRDGSWCYKRIDPTLE